MRFQLIAKAHRVLEGLAAEPGEYMLYPMPDGSLALDTRGEGTNGALIVLNTDGTVCCSGENRGKHWHLDYPTVAQIDYPTVLAHIRSNHANRGRTPEMV